MKTKRKWKGKGWMVVGACGSASGQAYPTRREARESADRTKYPAAYWWLRDPIKVIRVQIREV